jgi:sugar/nucleoside kinase (ribokinase family)
VAIGVQGWLRTFAADGRVGQLSPRYWQPDQLLRHSRALFVSEEDLPPAETDETLNRWAARVPILFLTLGYRGARLWSDGAWQDVPAIPAREVDPTGAGDVFAAAFLTRYLETDDVAQASLFAAAAAAISVEAVGTAGSPSRAEVEERLRRGKSPPDL